MMKHKNNFTPFHIESEQRRIHFAGEQLGQSFETFDKNGKTEKLLARSATVQGNITSLGGGLEGLDGERLRGSLQRDNYNLAARFAQSRDKLSALNQNSREQDIEKATADASDSYQEFEKDIRNRLTKDSEKVIDQLHSERWKVFVDRAKKAGVDAEYFDSMQRALMHLQNTLNNGSSTNSILSWYKAVVERVDSARWEYANLQNNVGKFSEMQKGEEFNPAPGITIQRGGNQEILLRLGNPWGPIIKSGGGVIIHSPININSVFSMSAVHGISRSSIDSSFELWNENKRIIGSISFERPSSEEMQSGVRLRIFFDDFASGVSFPYLMKYSE